MESGWLDTHVADRAPIGDLPQASVILSLAFEHSPLAMSLSLVGRALPGIETPRAFMVNAAMGRMLGYTVEELLAERDQSRFTHPDDRPADAEHVARLINGTDTHTTWDKRYLHADGHVVWGRVSLSLLRRDDGSPWFTIAQIEDITLRRGQEGRLRDLADRDDLTGLFNRRAVRQAAAEELDRCREQDGHGALIVIDLDGLKRLNDRLGHHVGDAALRAASTAIRGRLRASDVAARVGGDEFVVLLPGTDEHGAATVAGSVATAIAEADVPGAGPGERLGASVGIAMIDASTPDLDAVLAEADRNMYADKRGG